MITPRLFRRSLVAGAQWRLVAICWAVLLVPTLVAALPFASALSAMLDHSPRAASAVAFMDGAMMSDVLRQLGEPGPATAIPGGLLHGLLLLLVLSPIAAGALVTAARSGETLPVRDLLRGAGELYGRMLRMTLVALVVAGIGGALAGLVLKVVSNAGDKAIWATDASRQLRAGLLVSAAIVWLCHLTVDAGRARLAVEPERRSAFVAWWAGLRLVVRRPLRALGVGAAGSLAGLGLAALLFVVRLRVVQSGAGRIALAWVIAQLAVLAISWGRAARIAGLAELSRADSAERARRGFQMSPPLTSPPAPLPLSVAAMAPAATELPATELPATAFPPTEVGATLLPAVELASILPAAFPAPALDAAGDPAAPAAAPAPAEPAKAGPALSPPDGSGT